MKENIIRIGLNYTPFTPEKDKYYVNTLLYYGNGKFTDQYFIQNVGVFDIENKNWISTGEAIIFVFDNGNLNIGDFVTTCPLWGVGMIVQHEEVSFAKITNIIDEAYKGIRRPIRRVNVKFLQKQDNVIVRN